MTKMIKMSLIAAVAVTGMTSTVCAQPLEDAIKGVDVSGMLRYRYDEKNNDVNKVHTTANNYRLDINTKSKVNDIVTANVTVGLSTDDGKGVDLTNDSTDAAPTFNVRNANFAAVLPFATVIAGKQGIPGPFVDNTSDDVTRGTGAVALIPVGPVTLAAGHFMNHNVVSPAAKDTTTSSADLATNAAVTTILANADANEVALITNVAGVALDAWYVNVTDVMTGTSVSAKTTIAGVTIDARSSKTTMDAGVRAIKTKSGLVDNSSAGTASSDGKSSLNKIVASTKFGPVTVVAGYANTGKTNGQGLNRMAVDTDNDAQTDFRCWQASAGALPDASAILVGASMNITPSVNFDAKYLTVDFGTGSQAATESLATLTYAMSKNFSVLARYSMYEVKDTAGAKATDSDMGRLELKYTF